MWTEALHKPQARVTSETQKGIARKGSTQPMHDKQIQDSKSEKRICPSFKNFTHFLKSVLAKI